MRILKFVMPLIFLSTHAFAGEINILTLSEESPGTQSVKIVVDGDQSESDNVQLRIMICKDSSVDSCDAYGPFDAATMENILKSDLESQGRLNVEMIGTGFVSGLVATGILSATEKIFSLNTYDPRTAFLNWAIKGGLRYTAAFFVGAAAGGLVYANTGRGRKMLKDVEIQQAVDDSINTLSLNAVESVSLPSEYFNTFKRKLVVTLAVGQ